MAIPARTLQYWFAGPNRVYEPSGQYGTYSLLSFRDAAEAYRLFLLREFYQIPPHRIRLFLNSLRKESTHRFPLSELPLKVLEKTLVYDKPAQGKHGRCVIDLSGSRQLVFHQIADQFGKRIIEDAHRTPLMIYPWRRLVEDADGRPVSINPEIMSGTLVVTGTRVPVGTLLGMKRLGKTTQEIANRYRLSRAEVERALQHLERPVQKVA